MLRGLIDLKLACEAADTKRIEDAVEVLAALTADGTAPEAARRVDVLCLAVADARIADGDLAGAEEILHRVLDECTREGWRRHRAGANASLALIAALTGRIPQALSLTKVDAGVWSTKSGSSGGVHALAVAACAYHSDSLPTAEEAMTDARRELPPGVYRGAILPALRARIAASIGDVEASKRLRGAIAKNYPKLLPILCAALGFDDGLKSVPAEHLTSPRARHPHAEALAAVKTAVMSYEAQDAERAFAELEVALELAQRHEFRRLFVDSRLPVHPVLLGYVRRVRPFGHLAGQLLQRLPREGHAADAPIVETLTERELVVLRYLPSMMLNREIAAEMFFSENTVKTHLKSIYRKFGVTRRRDAVARARELSLL